jgi:XTP/dITP diphosphohydrolase
MREILLATNNPAKIKELTTFLSDIPVTIRTLKEVGITEQSPEDGRTFLENALTKAQFYFALSGIPCLADDGGIEIDALNREPGVDSHRWISKHKDDEDEALIAEIYKRMDGVPEGNRGAQMHVLLVFLISPDTYVVSEGVVRGVIAEQPSSNRTQGFPYRSVLYIPKIQKFYDHTVLTLEENEIYNHRRKALEQLKPKIKEMLEENI